MRLPNLLDSRVPDGDGEEENVVVSEWGEEYVKKGEVRPVVVYMERGGTVGPVFQDRI